MKTRLLWALVVLHLTTTSAQSFKQLHSKAVEKNVSQTLTKIEWKPDASLEELQQEAQQKRKMVFWLQLVGKLDDGL